jgi:hypothetical protein
MKALDKYQYRRGYWFFDLRHLVGSDSVTRFRYT